MHFVDKSSIKEPPSLKTHHIKYTVNWVNYVADKQKGIETRQPNDSRWTDDDIRLELVNLFLSNCGYCGRLTHTKKVDDKIRPQGHVDHFVPKSLDGNLVYKWENLIWSCKDCNEIKREYFPDLGYLNPCVKNDTDTLYYEHIDGKYKVKADIANEGEINKKYDNIVEKTMLNEDSISQERRTIVFQLNDKLNLILSIEKEYNKNKQEKVKDTITDQIESLKNIISSNKGYKRLQKYITLEILDVNHSDLVTFDELFEI